MRSRALSRASSFAARHSLTLRFPATMDTTESPVIPPANRSDLASPSSVEARPAPTRPEKAKKPPITPSSTINPFPVEQKATLASWFGCPGGSGPLVSTRDVQPDVVVSRAITTQRRWVRDIVFLSILKGDPMENATRRPFCTLIGASNHRTLIVQILQSRVGGALRDSGHCRVGRRPDPGEVEAHGGRIRVESGGLRRSSLVPVWSPEQRRPAQIAVLHRQRPRQGTVSRGDR